MTSSGMVPDHDLAPRQAPTVAAQSTSPALSGHSNESDEPVSAAQTRKYSLFVSYHRESSGRLARALQRGLHRFNKPFWKIRALRVFRDDSDLSLTPRLKDTLARALDDSDYLLLIASPKMPHSTWVSWELQYWLDRNRASRLLLAIEDGNISWAKEDFDWKVTDALPSVLTGKLRDEPRYLDLRWAQAERNLELSNPRFAECVADIASTITNQDKATLIGEDAAQHRRFRRAARTIILLLTALVGLSTVLAVVAESRRHDAAKNLAVAFAQKASQRASDLDNSSARLYFAQSLVLDDQKTTRRALAALPQSAARSVWSQAIGGEPSALGYSEYRKAYITGTDGGNIVVLDDTTGKVRHVWSNGTDVAALSVDVDLVAAGSSKGDIAIRDIETGEVVAQAKAEGRVSAILLRLGLLAVGFGFRGVRVYGFDVSAKTLTEVWGTEAHEISVSALALGNGLLYFPFAGHIKALNLETEELGDATLQRSNTLTLATDPTNRFFAAGAEDGSVLIVDHERQRRGNLPAHTREVLAMAFDQSSRYLATAAADADIRIWKLDPLTPHVALSLPRLTSAPVGVAFGADSSLAVADKEGRVSAFSVTVPSDELTGPSSELERTIRDNWGGQRPDSPLRSALETGRYSNMVTRLSFIDEQRLAGWGKDGPIMVWNLQTQEHAEFPIKPGVVSALQPYSGNRGNYWLASDVLGNEVSLHEVATGARLCGRIFEQRLYPMIAHPNRAVFIGGTETGTVLSVSCDRPMDIEEIAKVPGKPTLFSFDSNGGMLAIATESGAIQVMDWTTRIVSPVAAGSKEVLALAAEAGRVVAVVDDRALLLDHSKEPRYFVAAGLRRVAISNDAAWLALGDREGVIHVLDANDMQEIATLQTRSGEVLALAFDSKANRLASSGTENVVQLWDMAHIRRSASEAPSALRRSAEGETCLHVDGFEVAVSQCHN